MKKIDKLLELLNIDDQIIKEYCELKSLEVDQLSETWTFFFSFTQTIPPIHYRNLINHLKQLKNNIPSVKHVDYFVEFESIDQEYILEYYDFVIDEILETNKRIYPLKEYDKDIQDNKLLIYVPEGASSAKLFRNQIQAEMNRNGFPYEIDIVIDKKKESITEKIEQANEVFVEDNAIEFSQEIEYIYLTNGNPISDYTPLKQIPRTEMELEEYKEKHGGKAMLSVQGLFVYSEFNESKISTTVKFVITDGEDSIFLIKKGAKIDDVKFYKQIEKDYGVKARCYATYDPFLGEVVLHPVAIARSNQAIKADQRIDDAPEKRVELHLHTKMSSLDGVNGIDEYLKRAKEWGHKAIAVTDHNSVQTFPDLYNATKKSDDILPIYGLEMTYVDDEALTITRKESDLSLVDATYVVFDIETTGLSVTTDTLIEIAGVKVKNGATIGQFSELIDPKRDILPFTENLTGSTNSMVKGNRLIKEVLTDFHEFSKDCILVAHNADFDTGFLDYFYKSLDISNGVNPSIDTLILAKALLPNNKRFSLDRLSRYFKVPLQNHHRALDDTKATTEVFLHLMKLVKEKKVTSYTDLNSLMDPNNLFKYPYPTHINLLVQRQVGLQNMYKVLSEGLTTNYDRDARVLKSYLQKHREGLLVSSGCFNSHFFEIAMNKTREELVEAAKFYDILEVQPPSYFVYLQDDNPKWKSLVQDVIKKVVDVARELNILVVATGDVHHLDPRDLKYREIMINTPMVGGGMHYLNRRKNKPNEYFMTTEEMLDEFAFLGAETAYEIVVTNTNAVADSIDKITIIPKELAAPTDDFLADRGVPSIKEKVTEMVNSKVKSIYGDPLPEIVSKRTYRELGNIIEHHFSTVYYISHLLVKKSLDDGYLVGSRGSVGSSFVATLMDITEVNPLPPHYVCPHCKFSAFKKTQEEKEQLGETEFEKEYADVLAQTDCGWDLPNAKCPVCNAQLKKDGHDIPFETFLGFNGDKVPDIDLNFSGDYQGIVHEYIRELFGENHAFRAGTTGTCAAKTSFMYVKDYYEKINKKRLEKGLEKINIRRAEMERLGRGIEGVKRSSGQHPGGIVVVPNTHEIYDFTPIQYPGNATDRTWRTTHYDYHKIESNLFKLDVLGHDDPTMIRFLMDLVKENQSEFNFTEAYDIPVDDSDVYKLLSGTDILELTRDDLNSDVASFGIPEFGTHFVRGMLSESKPKSFAELVKISGLSHGTDVWINNAQTLVSGKNKQFKKIDFKDIIGCRDDIMVDLIHFGLEPTKAFKIMEFVRKGKAPKDPDTWAGYADTMRESNVPEWYIWSCSKIKYMFPKAHATAYVLMAMRIAWFKLYKPIYFYSAYFSKRASQFDSEALHNNYEGITRKISEIKELGNKATDRDQNTLTVLEVALEMVKRGFSFKPIDLYKSDSTDFVISEDKKSLILPFIVVDSLGTNVADTIIEARKEREFISKQDVKDRTKLSTTLFTKLEDIGVFDGMIEKNQMSLFDL